VLTLVVIEDDELSATLVVVVLAGMSDTEVVIFSRPPARGVALPLTDTSGLVSVELVEIVLHGGTT